MLKEFLTQQCVFIRACETNERKMKENFTETERNEKHRSKLFRNKINVIWFSYFSIFMSFSNK